MSDKPNFSRVAAYGVMVKDESILLCRLSAMVKEWEGQWSLPGGGIEFQEHPEEAVIREVHEETGYEVEIRDLIGVDSISGENERSHFHSIRIIYAVDIVGGAMRNEINGTTDLCEWHAIDEIEQLPIVDLVSTAVMFYKEYLQ